MWCPVPDLKEFRNRVESTFPGRCLSAFARMQGLDRAMVIASQAFTALIPLLIIVSAVLPTGSASTVSDAVIRKFALDGDSAAAVAVVFAHPEVSSVRLGSLLLLVFSGVSLTRRMQRMFQDAWGLAPVAGPRGSVHAELGLVVILVEVALLYLLRTMLQSVPFEWALSVPLSVGAGVVLWTTIPWLLLDRRIGWRRLLPTGALVGLSASLYGVATTWYMPRLMESYSERYGLFGVTIAVVGWLLCIALILVVGTVVAAEFDRAPEPWARHARAALRTGSPTTPPVGVVTDGTSDPVRTD